MKTYCGVEVYFHQFLILALDGVVSFAPPPFYPRTHQTGDLVGAPEPFWTQSERQKHPLPGGIETRPSITQLRHYTDWATVAPHRERHLIRTGSFQIPHVMLNSGTSCTNLTAMKQHFTEHCLPLSHLKTYKLKHTKTRVLPVLLYGVKFGFSP
jgi:hypothetical protein